VIETVSTRTPTRLLLGIKAAASDKPSLMLEMPGCWACDEMGAAFAGVFWGVLEQDLGQFGFIESDPR
jgi:hypothetical protein